MAHAIKKTDSQIQQDVLNELRWDTRVEETDVGVVVHRGVVTLTGTTTSWAKRLAAQEAAHRVTGVLDVANDLDVKLPGNLRRDDTEVAQAIRRALEWNVLVPHERIQSTVAAGTVSLEGDVDTFSERDDAEQAVRNLHGVTAVRNRIQVRPSKVAHNVHKALEDALARHAEREASHIDVVVRDGVATLSGKVESWAEKQRVLGAAKSTAGVRFIDDHVGIDA